MISLRPLIYIVTLVGTAHSQRYLLTSSTSTSHVTYLERAYKEQGLLHVLAGPRKCGYFHQPREKKLPVLNLVSHFTISRETAIIKRFAEVYL